MLSQEELNILKSKQAEKENIFQTLKQDIYTADLQALSKDLNMAYEKGYQLPDIEYASIGAEEYGLFYHVVRKLNDMVSAAFYEDASQESLNTLKDLRNKNRVTKAVQIFKDMVMVLYEAGLRPDVKSMSTLAAMTYGEVDPDLCVVNKGAPYGKMNDPKNFTTEIYLTTHNTMIYPFYMPYMKFSLVQRTMFDALVWLSSYVYERNVSNRNFDYNRNNLLETFKNYKLAEIVNSNNASMKTLQKTNTNEALDIDFMNIRLEQAFDTLLIMRTTYTNGVDKKNFEQEFNLFRNVNVQRTIKNYTELGWDKYDKAPEWPRYIERLRNLNKDVPENVLEYLFDKFKRAHFPDRMARKYFLDWTPECYDAMLRYGFALTHPGTLSRYDCLKFADTPETAEKNESLRKELEYFTKLYIDYKKLFFKDNGGMLTINEAAKLPIPVWSHLIFEVDTNWQIASPQSENGPDGKELRCPSAEYADFTSFDHLPNNFAWVRLCNNTGDVDSEFVRYYCSTPGHKRFGEFPEFFNFEEWERQKNDNCYWLICDLINKKEEKRGAETIKDFVEERHFPVDHHPKSTEYSLLHMWLKRPQNRENAALDIPKALISCGADPDLKDSNGNTCLFNALDGNFPINVIKDILAGTKDINSRNNDGYTPFSQAAMNYCYGKDKKDDERRKIYLELMNSGADPYLDITWQRHTRDKTDWKAINLELTEEDAIQALSGPGGFYYKLPNVIADCKAMRPDVPFKKFTYTVPAEVQKIYNEWKAQTKTKENGSLEH